MSFDSTPAAEWCGVSKRYGEALALDDLSLAARPGEFLTLLGPSGCGKTTCLRLLGGFEGPDAGAVFLAGQDVTGLPPHRREVNTVFQSYALFPHLDVRGNLAFGLRTQRLPAPEIARRVYEVAELVALDGLLDRRPDQLSGGQRQRVALARALVCAPRVLLLDEPLSALDARLRAQVRGELRALQRRLGLTFVFVTHDQEEALTLSDRVAVLNAGRVEQVGTPEDIYQRPASRFVAGFVGHANLLEAEVRSHDADGLRCVLPGGVGIVAPASPAHSAGTRVTLLIRPENVRLAMSPDVGANCYSAEVVERTFQGAGTLLTLALQGTGKPSLRLRVLQPGAAPALGAGAAVLVSIDPADVRVLP